MVAAASKPPNYRFLRHVKEALNYILQTGEGRRPVTKLLQRRRITDYTSGAKECRVTCAGKRRRITDQDIQEGAHRITDLLADK
jgi:hypothetical protein